MAYTLHITNKNYSSWSMRPWVLMRAHGIPFKEEMHVMEDRGPVPRPAWLQFSPTAKVPCLHVSSFDAPPDQQPYLVIWDSLAIAEFLAEAHPSAPVWPADRAARAWARSAAAEMHASFGAVRDEMSMNCGLRVELGTPGAALRRDLDRLDALWAEGLRRFGGPFLAGDRFGAVDAFFAPVAFRLQTFGAELASEEAHAYAATLRGVDACKEWYEQALEETWVEGIHDDETVGTRKLLQDLRKKEA